MKSAKESLCSTEHLLGKLLQIHENCEAFLYRLTFVVYDVSGDQKRCSKNRIVFALQKLLACISNNFVLLLKNFIANVLKCKARLKGNFKCVCVTMCSLVMGLFSCD